jgi:DNA replication protein DnaC
MTLPLPALRQQVCSKDAAGRWLCRQCRQVLLSEDSGTSCATCSERADQERRERIRVEELKRWENEQRTRIAQMHAQLPKWPHIRTAEEVRKVIARELRPLAEVWEPVQGCVLAAGPTGCGKTTAITHRAWRLGEGRLEAFLATPTDLAARRAFLEIAGLMYVKASALARAMSEHRLGSGAEPELVKRAVESRVLVIDELGPEEPRHSGAMFDIVDRRSEERLSTVVTSGQTIEALVTRYGTGLIKRLSAKGIGRLVDLHGTGDRG